ncbi:hypothetical protein [Nocardia sp. CA-135398]|uniref:hypothetical protein n=1 Tax=Nocardia sp. CA-135398 TaxID=3239977 RepID=UPI003D95CCDF
MSCGNAAAAGLIAVPAYRSAGPVDLVLAATAELRGLTLPHRDHDFETASPP